MNTIVVCSMLHEAADLNSATRRFRGEPVLAWTMRRLAMSGRIDRVIVLAWDDQLDALADLDVNARACGARNQSPQMKSITAAQRWADGWRGGLLQSCTFDKGFSPEHLRAAMTDEQADAIVLVEPAAGLVDPGVIDALVEKAEHALRDFYFTQAAPGLAGVLLKRSMLEKLMADRVPPGKLVHYLPDAPVLDPITSEACVEVPLEVSRVPDRFTLDSDRQISRLTEALQPLNGTLISSQALAVVQRVRTAGAAALMPRDIVLELTPRRMSHPIFSPAGHQSITRGELSASHVDALLADLRGHDGLRITLAGVGDPMLHPQVFDIIAKLAKIASVSVETDLLGPVDFNALVESGVDVVAVHLPAATPAMYSKVMGVDRMAEVVTNIQKLMQARHSLSAGTPVVAPLFTKIVANFDEMEAWYDTWLRAIGSAVIVGPSTFGGVIPDCSVADMTPPTRKPCARLNDRLTILSDGSIVRCEQDVIGRSPLGRLGMNPLADVWRGPFNELREVHKRLAQLPELCNSCSEWHRP
jgi:hypothetical protein